MKSILAAILGVFLLFSGAARAAEHEAPSGPPPALVQLLLGAAEHEEVPKLRCQVNAKMCVFHYRFAEEITGESVAKFQRFMAAAQEAGAKAVVVELDTAGGNPFAGHEMTRTIEMSPLRVVCIADGVVASAGMYVFQSCDARYMTKRSFLLTHNVSLQHQHGTEDDDVITIDSAQDMADTLRVESQAFAEQILRHAKHITVDEYMRRVAHVDWEMGYAVARYYGFIDKVWDKLPNDLYAFIRDQGRLP